MAGPYLKVIKSKPLPVEYNTLLTRWFLKTQEGYVQEIEPPTGRGKYQPCKITLSLRYATI
jgi:hypothetical protein